MVIKQKPEGSEWVKRKSIWEKYPGIGISKCKGPEVSMFGKFKDQKEDHQSYSGENEEMSN